MLIGQHITLNGEKGEVISVSDTGLVTVRMSDGSIRKSRRETPSQREARSRHQKTYERREEVRQAFAELKAQIIGNVARSEERSIVLKMCDIRLNHELSKIT